MCNMCDSNPAHTLPMKVNFTAEALLDSFGYHYYPNQPATEYSSRICGMGFSKFTVELDNSCSME